jgi:hypothetical protein
MNISKELTDNLEWLTYRTVYNSIWSGGFSDYSKLDRKCTNMIFDNINWPVKYCVKDAVTNILENEMIEYEYK